MMMLMTEKKIFKQTIIKIKMTKKFFSSNQPTIISRFDALLNVKFFFAHKIKNQISGNFFSRFIDDDALIIFVVVKHTHIKREKHN